MSRAQEIAIFTAFLCLIFLFFLPPSDIKYSNFTNLDRVTDSVTGELARYGAHGEVNVANLAPFGLECCVVIEMLVAAFLVLRVDSKRRQITCAIVGLTIAISLIIVNVSGYVRDGMDALLIGLNIAGSVGAMWVVIARDWIDERAW